MQISRLSKILFVSWRYGLDEIAASGAQATYGSRWMLRAIRIMRLGRRLDAPRGARLRMALEALGPIFVKFGQVLSTRRDLLPPDQPVTGPAIIEEASATTLVQPGQVATLTQIGILVLREAGA